MKLKHVLFSSLFLSAALVACTNDEFAEMQVPSVDTADAISLGEGFTISGAQVAMDPSTKSFFEEESNGIKFNWEEDDILGAAWFNAIKEGGIGRDGYVVSDAYVQQANSNGKFAWNVDFNLDRFVGDDQGSAYFTANTNVSAGAYVMYSPWNEKISQEFSNIPVELEFPVTVNLAEGHEYDAVNENMFSYGVAAFVPGGRQTDKFNLRQVPVLFGLRLGIDYLKLVDLDNWQTIDRVVIEAYDNTGVTVLTTAGTVTPPTEDVTARKYNEYIDFIADNTNDWENNPLPQAKYAGVENAKVNHYTIDLVNSDQQKYQISTIKDQLTDRIIFSSLPTMGEATKLVVKVITDKGITLTKTFDDATDPVDAAALAAFNKAQTEGATVQLNVFVDSQSKDKIIYTAGQFQEQWDAAVKEGGKHTLVVADPVVLEDITLTCSNPDADITIKLDDSQVKATLKLKGIDVERGMVTIEDCPVEVSGDIVSSANLNIKGSVAAKNIILNSNSNTMNIVAMENLEVRESGNVVLVLPNNALDAENIGNITVYNQGRLTVKSGYMNKLVTVKDGGIFTLTGDVTNLGTFTGKVATTNTNTVIGKFINAGTATLATGSIALVENMPGAVMNLNGNNTTCAIKNGSVNSGNIFVQTGVLNASYMTQGAAGFTTIEKGAKVLGTNNTLGGWFIIKEMASKDVNLVINNLAYRVESADDFTPKTGINNYFLFADVKMKGTWSSGNLYIFTDQTIADDVNVLNHVYVSGDIKFSSVDPEKAVVYTQDGYGSLNVSGSLYLNEGVHVKTTTNAWIETESYGKIKAANRYAQLEKYKPNVHR